MSHITHKIRMHRRLSAIVLLPIWIWCVATTAVLMAMMTEVTRYESPFQMLAVPDGAAEEDLKHSIAAAGEVQYRSAVTPECCPEEINFLLGQHFQSNLFLAALTLFFVLVLFSRQTTRFHILTRRLIPLPSVRLYTLHCCYLN